MIGSEIDKIQGTRRLALKQVNQRLPRLSRKSPNQRPEKCEAVLVDTERYDHGCGELLFLVFDVSNSGRNKAIKHNICVRFCRPGSV